MPKICGIYNSNSVPNWKFGQWTKLFHFIRFIIFESISIFVGREVAVLYFFQAVETGLGYSFKFKNQLGPARQRRSMPRWMPVLLPVTSPKLSTTLRTPPH
jgi:hypothetical protein